MTILYRSIGNVVAKWEEVFPLSWTIDVPINNGAQGNDSYNFDLSPLKLAFEEEFLFSLKDVWIEEAARTSVRTAFSEYSSNKITLLKVYQEGGRDQKRFENINIAFVLLLNKAKDKLPAKYLKDLKRFYRREASNVKIFQHDLSPNYFPERRSATPGKDKIDAIIAKALRRETLVSILSIAEVGFESGEVSLGRYAALKLALSVFCRPESYRKILLRDLRVDKNPETGVTKYFLEIVPAKTRVENPKKDVFVLSEDVGVLLALQREDVVKNYGHLAPIVDDVRQIGMLPMFPSIQLKADRTGWVREEIDKNYGRLNSVSFVAHYLTYFANLAGTPFGASRLRHTIGTSLAQIGCSSSTIQAVLKHADNTVAKQYVDIAFEGLIDDLSESMEEGFREHFPVFQIFASKSENMPAERRIDSDAFESGAVETTGLCGRTVACNFAPLACYGCVHFIPCYDADHSINLELVEREIAQSERQGLAMQHDVQRWRLIANQIAIVIGACEARRRTVQSEVGHE